MTNLSLSNENRLWFIATIAQWAHLVKRREWGSHDMVVTGDGSVLFEAQKHGVNAIDLWCYFDGESQCECYYRAHQICTTIWKKHHNDFIVGGVDYLQAFVFDLLCPIWAALSIQEAVTRFLCKQKGNILCPLSRGRYFLWDPVDPSADLFNECVEIVAKELNRNVKRLESFSDVSYHNYEENEQTVSVDKFQHKMPKTVTCISHCGSLSVFEQEALFSFIKDKKISDYVAVVDHVRSDVPSLSRKDLFTLPFCELSIDSAVLHKLCDEIQTRCNGAFRHIDGALPLWFKHLAKVAGAAKVLARGFAPSVVVLGYDAVSENRITAQMFRNAGVSVLSVDHVGLPVWSAHLRHSLINWDVAVWGASGRACQKKSGRNGRVFEVGCLRKCRHEDKAVCKSAEKRSQRVAIVTATAAVSTRMHGRCRPSDLLHSWEKTKRLFQKHNEWQLIIKPHPRYDMQRYYHDCIVPEVPHCMVTDEPIENICKSIDAAILYNTPSTAIMPLIQAGVPVIFFRDVMFPEMTSALDGELILQVGDHKLLEATLVRLAGDGSFKKSVLDKQEMFREKEMIAFGEEAARSLWEVVTQYRTSTTLCMSAEYRWLIDVIAWAGGYIKTESIQKEQPLKVWAPCPKIFNAEEFNGDLKVHVVGEWLLKYLLLQRERLGSRTALKWAPGLVLELYFNMPRSIRPSLRILRRYYIRALKNILNKGDISILESIYLWTLAPGYMSKRLLHVGDC